MLRRPWINLVLLKVNRSMDEHSFIRSVHRYISPEVYRWKINARFARGIPDAWYSGPAGDLWVEYKWLPQSPRRFVPKLSANQRKWLRDRYQEGRRVAVIIGCPQGAMILTDRKWEQRVEVDRWQNRKAIADWINAMTELSSTEPAL